jgi:hypothetical protein
VHELEAPCTTCFQVGRSVPENTKSQYNRFLNDNQFSGAGIASEGDWVVVVLSTSTGSGDYSPALPGSNWAD